MKLSNENFLVKKDSKRGCLILHGFGGNLVEVSPVVEELKNKNINLLGKNYPGHDAYAEQMPYTTWLDWLKSARDSYLELKQHCDEIDIIAFSAGSLLAVQLANDFNVNKLIFLSPFVMLNKSLSFHLPDKLAVHITMLLSKHSKRKGIGLFDTTYKEEADTLLFNQTFNMKSLLSLLELVQKTKPLMKNIENSSLVFHSTKDEIADFKGGKYLYNQLSSRNKEFIELSKSKHSILLDFERELVIKKIMEFLDNE